MMTLLKNYYQLTDSEQTPSKEINKSEIYREAARVSLKSRHFYQLYIFGLLILYCAVFYYFGEIAALFHWETLKLNFPYARYIQHAAFLVPIVFASWVFKLRGALIAILISAMIILARFLFISPL